MASPLAARPYDLRHAALSSWFNAGVDPTEVAERAGNSVEVLLSRYAKCLDGRQDVANRRIAELLGEGDDQEEIKNWTKVGRRYCASTRAMSG